MRRHSGYLSISLKHNNALQLGTIFRKSLWSCIPLRLTDSCKLLFNSINSFLFPTQLSHSAIKNFIYTVVFLLLLNIEKYSACAGRWTITIIVISWAWISIKWRVRIWNVKWCTYIILRSVNIGTNNVIKIILIILDYYLYVFPLKLIILDTHQNIYSFSYTKNISLKVIPLYPEKSIIISLNHFNE